MPASTPSTRPNDPTMSFALEFTLLVGDAKILRILDQLKNVDLDNLEPKDRERIDRLLDQLGIAQAAVDKPLAAAEDGQPPTEAEVANAASEVNKATNMAGVLERLGLLEADVKKLKTDVQNIKTTVDDLPNVFAKKSWVEEQFSGAKNYIDDTRNIALEAKAMASVKDGGRVGAIVGLSLFVLITLVMWAVNAIDGTLPAFWWAAAYGAIIGAVAGLIVGLFTRVRAHAKAQARIGRQQASDQAEGKDGASSSANAGSNTGAQANAGTHA